jgi:hypothetical protein
VPFRLRRPHKLMSGKLLAVAVMSLGFAASPAVADVLVEAIPKHLVCGDAITPGIWAQPGTTGSRKVRIKAIDRRTGRVWWRKTARATSRRWRNWYLPSGRNGQCGSTTIVYDGPGWTMRFRTSFRSEGV